MKSPVLSMALSALAMIAMGCSQGKLEGQMNVAQDISVQTKDGNLQRVPMGVYQIEAKVDAGDREVKVEFGDNTGLRDMKIQLPPNVPLNSDQLNMKVYANEINQPWDMTIAKETQVSSSEVRRGTEYCYTPAYRYDAFCGPYYWDNYYGPTWRYNRCYYDNTGIREVEYYTRTTQTGFFAEILAPGTNIVLATLNTISDQDSDRVYTYRGVCR